MGGSCPPPGAADLWAPYSACQVSRGIGAAPMAPAMLLQLVADETLRKQLFREGRYRSVVEQLNVAIDVAVHVHHQSLV